MKNILNKIEIRNNFKKPPKKFLDELGITLREFMFLKWKKHRELEQSIPLIKSPIKSSFR